MEGVYIFKTSNEMWSVYSNFNSERSSLQRISCDSFLDPNPGL